MGIPSVRCVAFSERAPARSTYELTTRLVSFANAKYVFRTVVN